MILVVTFIEAMCNPEFPFPRDRHAGDRLVLCELKGDNVAILPLSLVAGTNAKSLASLDAVKSIGEGDLNFGGQISLQTASWGIYCCRCCRW